MELEGKDQIFWVPPLGRLFSKAHSSEGHVQGHGGAHTRVASETGGCGWTLCIACHVESGPDVAKFVNFLKGEVFFYNGKFSHF